MSDFMTTTPKPVILVPGDTKPHVLTELRKAGYVPIATDAPEKVTLVTASSRINGDDLLMSAMAGVEAGQKGLNEVSAFFNELHSRLKKKEPKP